MRLAVSTDNRDSCNHGQRQFRKHRHPPSKGNIHPELQAANSARNRDYRQIMFVPPLRAMLRLLWSGIFKRGKLMHRTSARSGLGLVVVCSLMAVGCGGSGGSTSAGGVQGTY